MKCRKYTKTEKDQLLKEVKDCGNVAAVAKKHEVPLSTLHTWLKSKCKSENSEKAESDRSLKKRLSNLELENKILRDLLKKTNHAWLGK